jgi:hypothetical protein
VLAPLITQRGQVIAPMRATHKMDAQTRARFQSVRVDEVDVSLCAPDDYWHRHKQ